MRDFYRSVVSMQAVPKLRSSLGSCMVNLRRQYRGKPGYRKLHGKEVQLLMILHDAGFPVLGKDTLGKVARVGVTSTWRWEFDGVFGDDCDTEAAALGELRVLWSRLYPAWSEVEARHAHLLSLKEALRAENAVAYSAKIKIHRSHAPHMWYYPAQSMWACHACAATFRDVLKEPLRRPCTGVRTRSGIGALNRLARDLMPGNTAITREFNAGRLQTRRARRA